MGAVAGSLVVELLALFCIQEKGSTVGPAIREE
jgi:hypothetical protein